jgi:uncharacterized protein
VKIILPGGTGQLGHLLTRELTRAGHTCIVLTREPTRAQAWLARTGLTHAARAVAWDARTADGPWAAEFDGADAVINLAGRSVNCRYTERNLAAMHASRVDSTRAVGAAIAAAARPPEVWLQASTATLYAHTYGPAHDEATGVIGGTETAVPAYWRRSIEIATAWESALFTAPTPRTRRVALRSAMVMSPDRGGVFDAFAHLTRLGMGRQGHGRQYVSWIHDHDFVSAIKFLLTRNTLAGPVNLSAPEPLPNAEFIAALHTALGRRWAVPAPAWLLELGAFFRRTDTELLLKSRRVVPARLQAAGFNFRFSTWPTAAHDLAARWRKHLA